MRFWQKLTSLAAARRGKRSAKRNRRAHFEPLEARRPLAADITTGLVHHWTFDETSGDVAADVAGGSTGSLVNWSATEPKWEPGRVGGALRFDTSDNYVVANPPAMSGSFSVSFWLNVKDRSGVNPRILASRQGNEIFVGSTSNKSVGFISGSSNFASPEPSTFNTWEHFALKFNAATGQGIVYRSGTPVAIGAFTDGAALNAWFIGHSNNPNNSNDTLKGALDDLRVYDRLLTDEDIAALGNLGSPEPIHQGPVHHWTFDETTGFTAHDTASGADAVLLNWSATEPRWVPGIVGGAVEFSTADNAIVTPPTGTHTQWSIAFWINLTGGENYPRILNASDDRDLWAYLGTANGKGVSFRSRGTETIEPGLPPFGVWSHYAINFDTVADVGTIFRDGVQVASGYFGDNSPAQAWVIGHNPNLANHQDTLRGLLDDLRVYDRLLSPSEIQTLAATISPQPPTEGLTHHWTFDETTGNVAADIVGGNDGQLQNFSPTQETWVPGKIGGAIRFSEANDLVITESAITQDQYTISFWLNQIGQGGFNPRIATTTDTIEEWIVIAQNVDLGICMGACDPQLPRRGVWEHFALTFDPATDRAEIFRNGVSVASGSFLRASPLVPWVLGHHADLNKHLDTLDGMLDDMRVYDRLLSPAEIRALAGVFTPQPPTTGLIHHWRFDETQGSIAEDSAGSNDGELRNYGPTQPKWVPGKIGGAIRFSDSDDLVITQTPITKNKYTFAFWLNQTGGGGFNPRLINPGDEDWFILWEFADRGITFGGTDVWDPRQATPNTWEHYAITLDQDANRVEFYRDGVLVASGSYPDKPPPLKQWVMGHSGTLTHHVDTLDGMLDDMRVYDRLLSASEVQQLAQLKPLVAVADAFIASEDTVLFVASAQGLKKNDSDLGANTRAVLVQPPGHGQVSVAEDGSFTYAPAQDYNGNDSFTYRLMDGPDASEPVTVTLNVTPVNDAPSFVVSVPEFVISDEHPRVYRQNGEPVPSFNLPELLRNRVAGPAAATDETSQSLTWSVTNDNPEIFADPPSIDHRGTVRFTPAPNASGTAVVTVTVQDNGGTADGGIDTTVKTFVVTVVKPHPLLNVVNPHDPTGDGFVVAGDVLEVINFINAFGAQPVEKALHHNPSLLDVTGDNFIAAGDALAIINVINAGGATPLPASAAATFVELDTTTQGNWPAKYGSEGYAINSSIANLPAYADVSFTGGPTDLYDYIVSSSTSDPIQLVKPGTNDRINSAWTGDHGFTLNLHLDDGQTHRVALYMVEGVADRWQKLEVLDAQTGTVLDTRTLDDFETGAYLVWDLRGNLKIRFTNLANGLNAVLSGIFFD